jgi:hypothetical protein
MRCNELFASQPMNQNQNRQQHADFRRDGRQVIDAEEGRD